MELVITNKAYISDDNKNKDKYIRETPEEIMEKAGLSGIFSETSVINMYAQRKDEENIVYLDDLLGSHIDEYYDQKDTLYMIDNLDKVKTIVVSIEDFNKMWELFGREPLSIGRDEYFVLSDEKIIRPYLDKAAADGQEINFAGHKLTPAFDESVYGAVDMTSNHTNAGILVVDGSVLEGREPMMRAFHGNYKADSKEEKRAVDEDMRDKVFEFIKDNYTDKVHTHNYTSQVTRTATCAATGIRTYTCSCGDTYTETIPKTAHNYTEKVIAPTYEAQGYTLHTCSVCGNSYKDNYTDKLAVHTHSYTSKVTKAATCAATGIRTYTCSCGDSYTEIIPMAEHNYTAKTVAPTYTAQGYTQHTCSVCGDSYKDTYTAKLTPKTESISKATVTGIGAKTYTGKAITQSPVVKLSGKTLKAGTDYTVAYKNNTKVGTATVTITGKGSYTGTISKTFKINAASIAKATVSGISNKTYTGKAITQNPTVKLGSKTLKKGTDYTVSYKNNKAVGKATVTIKGKGNYTGTISKTFKINPKKTTLKTATSPKTKQLKVTYSKLSGVTGYQTVYSTSSKFTKATTKTASSKSTSKTISGLTKGKTYYVKVRTYKTVNGTKYYSGYSAVKKKKIK